jgi:inorganic triphosphatase YgiF
MAEVELKFAVDPRAHIRLAAKLFPAHGRTVLLDAIYFDTPECDLEKARMALRLRRAGSRWRQTLKAGGSGTGGLHTRDEWEYPAKGPVLDLSRFADTPLARLPEPASLHERLVPAFRVRVRRRIWLVRPARGSRLEVALDLGTVDSADRAEQISELEVECLEGNPLHAFALAARLQKKWALRPSAVTKAERGYRLFRDKPRRPVKARPSGIDPAASLEQVARSVVASCIDQAQGNEEGVLASDDPGFVHQARVGMRRARSALKLFRKAIGKRRSDAWREALRGSARALGGARDWDVFATQTLPALCAAFGDEAASREVEHRAALKRTKARKRARTAIESKSHGRAMLSVAQWLSEPPRPREAPAVRAFAAGYLEKHHRQLRGKLRDIERLSPPERHRVRILAKRLRYAVEFLGPALDAKAGAYAKQLGALQDALGYDNDCAVGEGLMESLHPPPALRAFSRDWFARRVRENAGQVAALASSVHDEQAPAAG